MSTKRITKNLSDKVTVTEYLVNEQRDVVHYGDENFYIDGENHFMGPIKRKKLEEIRTIGRIDYDERKLAYVASRIFGSIDKLFVDFTGVDVKREEPLVWIYSPSLISTQEEYLLALETLEKVKESHIKEVVENAKSLVESTKRRLLLWGITDKQIEELEEKKVVETHMIVYAPISGTVIHKTAMEGKYVKEGENIYRIANLSNVWMLADIYEKDIG